MKKLVIGILAPVDAGKTTLSESMLYLSGKIRKLGRVDTKDAYLDTFELEKARGITIFSKQALFEIDETQITLLDTPGHIDFSAEMERTLQVLDYAILVVSGADGIQGHTQTLWDLLNRYQLPVFLFINKMDQQGTHQEALIQELRNTLSDGCISFSNGATEAFYEQLALCDETLMDTYLETGTLETYQITTAIKERKVFPCFFGSALKLEGIEHFMQALVRYSEQPTYPTSFGAKVFKIARDEQGNRLTYMKITGGTLKVKMALTNQSPDALEAPHSSLIEPWEEKVNQIRVYSGQRFESVTTLDAGSICAVTGLTQTRPGEGLGIEQASRLPILEPVLSYRILLPEGYDPRLMLPKLRQLEEEEPELHMLWNEPLQEIQVQLMGEVQIEVLQSVIKNRFDINVHFDSGTILYKETLTQKVEGVGHFEPLRHYAEVHLLLEPGEEGSGLQFDVNCNEDLLERNWQRLVLSHLEERVHRGVLTGSPITDLKITLIGGRAHKKHTEGGDFREATYRAVRQGLKEAQSLLLEPYYEFQLKLPDKMVGRAMMDIEKMAGSCQISQVDGTNTLLTGTAPVATMRNYQKEVYAYTKGQGRLFCSLKGYGPCHNAEEVIEGIGYDSERDLAHPTGSVFCSHGAGFLVPWNEVKKYRHVSSSLQADSQEASLEIPQPVGAPVEEKWIGLEEIDAILNKTFYANRGEKSVWKKRKTALESYYETSRPSYFVDQTKAKYLLVDGYNIIYAWPELKELVEDNMEGARIKLLECLSNYRGTQHCEIIVVFDAYRVKGHQTEIMDYHNIHVVYTKEAETADHYIEKFAHTHQGTYHVTVATSDSLEQTIIRGAGCSLMSARELKEHIERTTKQLMEQHSESQLQQNTSLADALPEATKDQLKNLFSQ